MTAIFLPTVGSAVADQIPPSALNTRFGYTYEWDFSTGQFVQDPGTDTEDPVALIDQGDTLEQVLKFLLLTPRYSALVNPTNYGSSVQARVADVIANGYPDLQAYVESAIKETLRSEPRFGNVETLSAVLDDPDTPTEIAVTLTARDVLGGPLAFSVTIPL